MWTKIGPKGRKIKAKTHTKITGEVNTHNEDQNKPLYVRLKAYIWSGEARRERKTHTGIKAAQTTTKRLRREDLNTHPDERLWR